MIKGLEQFTLEKIKRTNYVLTYPNKTSSRLGRRHKKNHVWLFERYKYQGRDDYLDWSKVGITLR